MKPAAAQEFPLCRGFRYERCSGGTYSNVGPAVVLPSPLGIFISAPACPFSWNIVPTAARSWPGCR